MSDLTGTTRKGKILADFSMAGLQTKDEGGRAKAFVQTGADNRGFGRVRGDTASKEPFFFSCGASSGQIWLSCKRRLHLKKSFKAAQKTLLELEHAD